jgi:hypothetical protein
MAMGNLSESLPCAALLSVPVCCVLCAVLVHSHSMRKLGVLCLAGLEPGDGCKYVSRSKYILFISLSLSPTRYLRAKSSPAADRGRRGHYLRLPSMGFASASASARVPGYAKRQGRAIKVFALPHCNISPACVLPYPHQTDHSTPQHTTPHHTLLFELCCAASLGRQ